MATAIPHNHAVFVLGDIAASCGGRVDTTCAATSVRGVVTDSRAVQPGTLYVALRGERHDGHKFLGDAQRLGAAAALVDQLCDAPAGLPVVRVADTRAALGALALLHRTRWSGTLIAITGSAGKSTTKELTAAALVGLGRKVLRTEGNLNNEIGVPMTLLCLEPSHDAAVIELGTSGPGEIATLAQMAKPDVGVVTTVSLAHTLGLGSLAEVADEKCALLRMLGDDGVAAFSSDSEPLRQRVGSFGGRRALSFGTREDSEVRLLGHEVDAGLKTLCRYRVRTSGAEIECRLALPGVGPALDAAAVLTVVLALYGEAALQDAARAMQSVTSLPGRLQPRTGPSGALIIDDTYNANPASVLASLSTLVAASRAREGKAMAALGDMAELGAHSRAEHERVGAEAIRLGVSTLVLCGTEMAHAAAGARAAAAASVPPSAARIEHYADPMACVGSLRTQLGERDALLVKGSRSMAMERVVVALCDAAGGAA